MPIPEACLRTRLLAARCAPLLPARVAVRRMSAPAIPPRAEQSQAPKERLEYAGKGYKRGANWSRQDRNVAMFRRVVDGEGKAGGESAERIKATVSQLHSGVISTAEAWDTLEGILSGVREGERVAPLVRTLVETIMALKRTTMANRGARDGPSVTQLMDVYVGVGNSRNRRPVMRLLNASLEHLVRQDLSEEETKAVLEDVARLWVGLFEMSHYMGVDGIRVPSLRYRKMQMRARGPDPFSALVGAALMPTTSPEPLLRASAALLTTYVLVEERGLRSSDVTAPIAPLLSYAEKLMDALWTSPDDALLEFAGADQPDALRDYVAARLNILQARASPGLDPEHLHRLLSRGLKTRDAEHTRRTWASLTEQVESLAPRFEADPALRERYARLLDFCVCIWCALGREDVDVVLHFMATHGFGYTLKTYTSMIEGWKLARRPQNIARLWERLASDGVRLDTVIWSARISALMTCGLEKPAVRALFEMGQLWDAAVKDGEEARAVKPGVGPVNAALAGVLRSKGVSAAPAILSWAARYDVEPDVATHNMLLRAMLHEGRGEEADALLRDMRERGVAADAATFTIIVEEVLGAAAPQSEERRVEAVRGIFAAIEASGQSAKAATYAKMVHVLLEGAHAGAGAGSAVDGPAVKEVLGHMQRRGVGPTSHVFTILANHLLACGAAPAVRDMIATWRLSGSDRVDGVFWEVVIRGFASAGLAGEARDMFFGLRRETRVALGVLDQLLVGLLEDGDTEGARALVREVRARMGEGGIKGETGDGGERFMKHRFWHVVAENGLDVE